MLHVRTTNGGILEVLSLRLAIGMEAPAFPQQENLSQIQCLDSESRAPDLPAKSRAFSCT